MKRKPHFRYFWEGLLNNVIRGNVRDNTAVRLKYGGVVAYTRIKNDEWPTCLEKQRRIGRNDAFPITRQQARAFVKHGLVPE